ncbi:MAG: hypothetical protein MnENMB40S_38450 [Rhizobiaceae bacterium MnEN-MB40S]|nr:MAG: hypothetical protein MnENMB40S_38450 [Rhizobiaceae bacterium MnEN-MB40S]
MNQAHISTQGGWIGTTDRLAAPVENLANFCAGLTIFILMLMGSAQIFLRSVFNAPIAGYIDLVQLSMATMAFLGAAYCQRVGAHIRMELLVGNLRGRALWAFETISTLVAIFIIAVIIRYGWDHFVRSYQSGDTTIDAEIIVWPSKLLVPLAFGLWLVRLLIQLAGSIRLFINPHLEPVGIARILNVSEIAEEEIKETFGEDSISDKGSHGGAGQ